MGRSRLRYEAAKRRNSPLRSWRSLDSASRSPFSAKWRSRVISSGCDMRVSRFMGNRIIPHVRNSSGDRKRVSQRRKAAKKNKEGVLCFSLRLCGFAALRLCGFAPLRDTLFSHSARTLNTNLSWRKGGDSNSYVRRRQFSGLVGYQVAHPFRMERRERVERSNAGFAVQPLTVCCCGAW